MKILKPIVGILATALLFSCSSEDSNPDLVKSNVEIKALTTGGLTTTAKSASAVEVSDFLINIEKIEFEFADGFGIMTGSSGSSSDDDDLRFDQLPNQIVTYLRENYPNDPFCTGELEDDNDPYRYEIELQSGTEIYFRSDFTVYAIEIDDEGCDDFDDDDNSFDFDDELDLMGPFLLSLNSNVTTVVQAEIPVGEYEKVEFKMKRGEDPTSDLYRKSIVMRGTISGTPFEFFHTFSEDFEVDYEDAAQNLVITTDNNNTVVFEFDLVSVFNNVNITNATDGNGNGIIEISPEDEDGNRQLANDIKNAIKDYVDLLDD